LLGLFPSSRQFSQCHKNLLCRFRKGSHFFRELSHGCNVSLNFARIFFVRFARVLTPFRNCLALTVAFSFPQDLSRDYSNTTIAPSQPVSQFRADLLCFPLAISIPDESSRHLMECFDFAPLFFLSQQFSHGRRRCLFRDAVSNVQIFLLWQRFAPFAGNLFETIYGRLVSRRDSAQFRKEFSEVIVSIAFSSAEKFSNLGELLRSIRPRVFRYQSLVGSKTLSFTDTSCRNTSFNIEGFSTKPRPRNWQIRRSGNVAKRDADPRQSHQASPLFTLFM
jgi:hypothetical protein